MFNFFFRSYFLNKQKKRTNKNAIEIAINRVLIDNQMEELESRLIKEILKNKAEQKKVRKSLESFVSKIN